jgi:hypothetical protein
VDLQLKVVQQSESGANTCPLMDTVRFRSLTKAINPQEFKRLYVDEGLSSTQVAARLGYSKKFVITTLKRLKLLRPKIGSHTNPKTTATKSHLTATALLPKESSKFCLQNLKSAACLFSSLISKE